MGDSLEDAIAKIQRYKEDTRVAMNKLSSKVTSDGSTALQTQQGGNHYKDLAIQPVEYIHKNDIPYLEGNVIKYITRHQAKNGAEDIKKAIHYCQLILELQYGEK